MANEKRLIDANARIEEIKMAYCTDCENYYGVRCRACWVDDAIGLIDDSPSVDAVELPEGKPGDYLEWDNGTGFRQIYHIHAVMIYEDHMRYDIEICTPVVNHPAIVRILSREQAVKEYRDRCAREKAQEKPTLTAERMDGDGNG